MAEEIGSLRAVLALESAAFDRGVAAARRQLSVLEGGLNKTGGQVVQFGQRMSRDATAGFRSLDRAARSGSGGLQNFGFQVQDVAVQIAGGTSATRALSQQLPQLLSGFGLFGVALGTASAVLIPLVGHLFKAGEATSAFAEELTRTGGTISSVQGAISALETVQRQYNEAITASGGASSAAAALVIANSEKEFQARKQLLAVETELLKIRAAERAESAKNLRDQFDKVFADRIERSRIIAETRQEVLPSSPFSAGPGLPGADDAFRARMAAGRGREVDLLALKKINAELKLMGLQISEAERLMNSTFDSIAGTGGGGGGGGGRSGGGAPAAAAAIEKVKTVTGQLSEAAKEINRSFESAFADIVTGAKDLESAVAGILKSLASQLAQSAGQGLNTLLFGRGGIGGALGFANGGAFVGGRVQAFAKGGVVTGPTLFPMANGAGLMGEAGPEAVMPLTRIGGKLGVRAAGGGGPVINIDARGAVEGTAAQIARAIQQAAPGIVQQSVSATRSAAARGR
ncbi:MAG: phage tail tape measure protein [Cereibacter sp.]